MRIKKYVADSMPEVLKLVKDDLGAKAVVLNTRTLAKTGILGKKGQVEVTAAIDEDEEETAPAVGVEAYRAQTRRPEPRPATPRCPTRAA